MFRKLDLFPSSGEGRHLLRNIVFFQYYLGKIRTMDKVRKPNISVCYTPSSEPYSIYNYSSRMIISKLHITGKMAALQDKI
jgi:hypothetical protein